MQLAEDIARCIIAKVSKATAGAAYEDAIQAGVVYWELVLTGKDATAAKQAADEALSRLLGCTVHVLGRKQNLKEKILRAFS